MNIVAWRAKNNLRRLLDRITHPWPLYKRAGGMSATVIRKDGTREDLGTVSDAYVRRGWGVSAGKG